MDYQVKQKELVKEAMFFAQYEEQVAFKEKEMKEYQQELEDEANEVVPH